MRHLLATNDFPPKTGGIQSYLWELWRRLPPEETFVHTTPYRGAAAFDVAQPFTITRCREPWLLPYPVVRRRIDQLAARYDTDLVIVDPGIPLGLVAPALERPYAVVVHGAEVTVPGRAPGTRKLLGDVLRGASLVIAAGEYPAAEAEYCAGRALPVVVVPPGVDVARFVPLDRAARNRARARYLLEPEDLVITSVSRLVPRKGMDVLIRAAAALRPRFPELRVVIAGTGRDRKRLGDLVATSGAPVDFAGFVPDADLPAFYGMADVFAMFCRSRWGGLEQEGFGIVFAEAAACGVPQVAGRSGGSDEAVEHGATGIVVDAPDDVDAAVEALAGLLGDPELRQLHGTRARARAEAHFAYDHLVSRLHAALAATVEGSYVA
jgi:phosphatidylinositol alpha-1,6-mannosyltransferase